MRAGDATWWRYAPAMLRRWREWARTLKREVRALGLAIADPRTPWYVKALAIAVIAYAVSPIDLIPDFIPVLGWLDDLLVLPLGIALVRALIGPARMAEHRAAADADVALPGGTVAAGLVIAAWIAALAAALYYGLR